MKRALCALFAVAVLLAAASGSRAAVQQSPSKGDTINERAAASDGRGVPFYLDDTLGLKVFEDSNSSTGILLADEADNNPTCGAVIYVCVGQQTENVGSVEYAQVTETAVVFSGRQGGNIVPRVFPIAAVGPNTSNLPLICTPKLNAQFNNTIQVWNSGTDLDTLVYWRPCGKKLN